jgi:hypothetical protein
MPNRKFIPSKKYKNLRQFHSSKNAVVNLSTHKLNIHEYRLLAKGLSFCVTPTPENPTNLLRDVLIFNRRLRLTHNFREDTHTSVPINPFKQPSGWTPKNGKNIQQDF